jgi:hypothetical protein
MMVPAKPKLILTIVDTFKEVKSTDLKIVDTTHLVS